MSAQGGTRTRKALRPRHFKCRAYTYSATRALFLRDLAPIDRLYDRRIAKTISTILPIPKATPGNGIRRGDSVDSRKINLYSLSNPSPDSLLKSMGCPKSRKGRALMGRQRKPFVLFSGFVLLVTISTPSLLRAEEKMQLRSEILKELAQAETAFRQSPDNVEARKKYANLLFKSGDFWKAREIR